MSRHGGDIELCSTESDYNLSAENESDLEETYGNVVRELKRNN